MKMTPRRFRFLLNLYPPYLFTGIRITHVSNDWRLTKVLLRRSILNRNYVGTVFGGCIYSAADPHHMLMLIQLLGMRDYLIWDKSAEIRFVKPARTNLHYEFRITDADLAEIRDTVAAAGRIDKVFTCEARDDSGDVVATFAKTVYVRRKERP